MATHCDPTAPHPKLRRLVAHTAGFIVAALVAMAPPAAAQVAPRAHATTPRVTRRAGLARARSDTPHPSDPRARSTPRRLAAGPRLPAPRALRADDFAGPLDRAALQRATPDLPDADFDVRWRGALASPAAFLRAYPAAFLADLRARAADAPGGRGVVFGDLHPDNFGFVRVGGETRYVFNDLDDGGDGAVALDAVRYFTALRLWGLGDDVVDHALDAYAHGLAHPAPLAPVRVPAGLRAPAWRQEARHTLEAVVTHDRFVLGDATGLAAPSPTERAEITAALARGAGPLRHERVLDVARRARDHGGSAGLARYWALVERQGARTLLEFKEAAPPAVEQLEPPAGGALAMDARLAVLERRFWGTAPAHDHVYTTLQGRRFLVRDRLQLGHTRFEALDRGAQRHVLRAQVRLITAVHAPLWGTTSPADARAWLDASSRVLAGRWRGAWERATAAEH